MKISIVIVEGAKQIMLTPETDHEKQALKFINPKDEIKVVAKWGSFPNEYEHAQLKVEECQGNYLILQWQDSLMFLIKDKKEDK